MEVSLASTSLLWLGVAGLATTPPQVPKVHSSPGSLPQETAADSAIKKIWRYFYLKPALMGEEYPKTMKEVRLWMVGRGSGPWDLGPVPLGLGPRVCTMLWAFLLTGVALLFPIHSLCHPVPAARRGARAGAVAPLEPQHLQVQGVLAPSPWLQGLEAHGPLFLGLGLLALASSTPGPPQCCTAPPSQPLSRACPSPGTRSTRCACTCWTSASRCALADDWVCALTSPVPLFLWRRQ